VKPNNAKHLAFTVVVKIISGIIRYDKNLVLNKIYNPGDESIVN